MILNLQSNIAWIVLQWTTKILLTPTQVRVHSSLLVAHPCSKLWYFLRALDRNNRGWIEVKQKELKPLQASTTTIYRWLQQGQERGFFKNYTWADGKLSVALGGLYKVCRFLKIESWGVVAEIPLSMLLVSNGRRMVASAITTQDLQERSRYAARQGMSRLERKCFDLPTANQLLQTSPKMTRGGRRGVVHIGRRRIFVGRRFIPFGTSQPNIAQTLTINPTSCGVSRWSVSRHLDKLEVNKRQIMQAKPEYREIRDRIRQGAASWTCKSDRDISFKYVDTGVIQLNEPNGDSSARRQGGHRLEVDKLHPYQNTVWVHRCNIYDLNFELTSMKYARYKFKKLAAIVVSDLEQTSAVENSVSPLDPPQEITLGACSEGSAPSGQIKSSNFENCEKADSQVIVEDSGRQTWLDAGAKLKALVEARKRARLERLSNL